MFFIAAYTKPRWVFQKYRTEWKNDCPKTIDYLNWGVVAVGGARRPSCKLEGSFLRVRRKRRLQNVEGLIAKAKQIPLPSHPPILMPQESDHPDALVPQYQGYSYEVEAILTREYTFILFSWRIQILIPIRASLGGLSHKKLGCSYK